MSKFFREINLFSKNTMQFLCLEKWKIYSHRKNKNSQINYLAISLVKTYFHEILPKKSDSKFYIVYVTL